MGLTSACIYMYHYHETKFYDMRKRELRCLIWPAAITTNNLAKRTNITKKKEKRLKVFFLQFFPRLCHHRQRHDDTLAPSCVFLSFHFSSLRNFHENVKAELAVLSQKCFQICI